MMKNILIKFAIFAAFAVTISVAAKPQVQLNLANTILTSSAVIQNDPMRSAQCFAVYLPQLNNLTAVYEEQYNECLAISEKSKESIKKEVQSAATTVNKTVEDICGGFAACDFDSDPYGYFECSNNAGGEAISKAYSIQTLSKDRMQYINLRYETILYDQNSCTSKCSEVYVRESAAVHAQLQACLAGNSLEVSTSSSSSVPPTTTTTTVAPTTPTTRSP